MSYIGTTEIGKMFLGDVEIDKAYLGSTLVFQSGSTPLPYTPLTYIQTDGTAYINTGIKGTTPRSAEFKVLPIAPSSGNAYYIGCRKDSGNTRFCFLLVASTKYAGLAYRNGVYASAIDISASINNATPMEVKSSLKAGTQKLQIKQQGDSSYTTYTASVSSSVSSGIDIHLFGWNNQGTHGGSMPSGVKWYGCKLYSDGDYSTCVFDGVPALYNGAYGMWDKISDSFFGNAAGSGAFTGQ